MTSANVLQTLKAQGQPVSANAKAAKPSAADSAGVSASFPSLLQGTACPVSTAKGLDKQPSFTRSETDTYSQKKIAPAEMKTAAEKVAAASETVAESGDNLRKTVAEKLGLDEDELESAMSVLGLSTFDLLNPQNLAQLFMQVSGGETEADLLLNPQFVELMQDISKLGENLMGQLGISTGEMDEVLAQLELLEQPVPLEQTLGTEQSAGMEQSAEMEQSAIPLENQQNVQENTEAVVENNLTAAEASGEVQLNQERGDAAENDGGQSGNPSEMSFRENGMKGAKESTVQQDGSLQGTVSFTESLENQVALEISVGENSYSSVDPLDVIRQIADNVRVSLSQENSSMEMQLNPENLGKIYLQVSVREGSVHATIAAQNEAVRAALESQVAELKENLNQAGVKVDAVEVTVASHEFEKNLEQNERQQQNEGERQQEQISRRKGSGMTLSAEAGEILSEEEELAARIMQDNGNSVDFTA